MFKNLVTITYSIPTFFCCKELILWCGIDMNVPRPFCAHDVALCRSPRCSNRQGDTDFATITTWENELPQRDYLQNRWARCGDDGDEWHSKFAFDVD